MAPSLDIVDMDEHWCQYWRTLPPAPCSRNNRQFSHWHLPSLRRVHGECSAKPKMIHPPVLKSNWKSLGWIIKIRLDFLWGCWGRGLGRGVGDTPGLVLDKTWIIPNRNRTFLLSLSCWASWRRDTDLQIKWCCNANNFNTWLCPCSGLGLEERWIIVQIGGVVRCKGGGPAEEFSRMWSGIKCISNNLPSHYSAGL